ncbi:MAG: sigma factor [Paraclostridium sp.]|uniref:sigma factor n=1 Tax=Paraclostridium sp. TaxID=2023273 RepID=UPI003EE55E70
MKITEENFILKLKQKDERALEYVIDNYGWVIKSIVKKSMYNLESYHDECLNDILIGVWNNIDRFDKNKCSFKNWVVKLQ